MIFLYTEHRCENLVPNPYETKRLNHVCCIACSLLIILTDRVKLCQPDFDPDGWNLQKLYHFLGYGGKCSLYLVRNDANNLFFNRC